MLFQSLRLIFGDEFLDRGRAVGALIIGLRHDPVAPVDPLAVERDAEAEADRIGVTAALRCADLALALPILPEFRRGELGARSLGRRLLLGRAPGAIVGQPRVDLGHMLGAGFLRELADRPDVALLLASRTEERSGGKGGVNKW